MTPFFWAMFGLVLLALGGPALGQALAVPAAPAEVPLRVGWFEIRPLFVADADGPPQGFAAEVMIEIAERTGLDLDFVRYSSGTELIEAQNAGEIAVTPGLAAVPAFAAQNNFSDPVAMTETRVFVRSDDTELLSMNDLQDRPLAVPPVSLGAKGQALAALNRSVLLPPGMPRLLALLRGDVDAIISTDALIASEAYQLRLDHRIIAIGPSLQRFDRVVTVHNSRASLLPLINAAIADMEADGTLAQLRARHHISLAPPAPDILTVGVAHFPPYNIIGEDGQFSGFAVESFRNLAGLAGLDVQFREISREEFAQGPRAGTYDILPQTAVGPERRARMDFTAMVDRSSYEIFTRAGEAEGISNLDSLKGLRVGVDADSRARRDAEAHGGLDLAYFSDHTALLKGLLAGQVDAIIYPRHTVLREAKRLGALSQITEIAPSLRVIDRAVALRFGLGQVRERLNAVIPQYLASQQNARLRAAYFETPVFWTQARVQIAVLVLGAILVLLIGAFLTILSWRQTAALRERRRYAAELVDTIPLGLVLVSEDGKIEFANDEILQSAPAYRDAFRVGQCYAESMAHLYENEVFSPMNWSESDMMGAFDIAEALHQDDTEIQLSNGRTVVRSARKLSTGSTLILRQDITEDRRKRRAIEGLNRELEHQVALAKAANDELRAFAYAISHDLKAPTNTARMLISEINASLEGQLAPDDAELMEDLNDTNKRMGRLIEDVLDYTNAIGSDASRTRVDLSMVLEEVLGDLRADIQAVGAKINSGLLPTLVAHPAQMRQLLQNLITNAIKFRVTGRSPMITLVRAAAPDGCVAFSVSDNGTGIPANKTRVIFELFSRLHATTYPAGSGLGLAICQRIAQNHRGHIDVQSKEGEGTRFTVTLEEVSHDPQSDAG